jgi:flavin-dependent dehydrogenase
MPEQEVFEVIVAGGGPGGSTAAALLAKNGRRVLLLEREKFPRFHIGESLLPANMEIFRDLGVIEDFEKVGFIKKYGAEFVAANGAGSHTFRFRNGLLPNLDQTYQVLRSEFDHILLKNAARKGAEVREEHKVLDVLFDDGGVTAKIQRPDGSTFDARAPIFVDATGRDTFLANKFRTKRVLPKLKKVALFAHYEGGFRAEGRDAGNAVIIRGDTSWFWMIPLAQNRMSVGVVMDRDDFKAANKSPEAVFCDQIAASVVMSARLGDARRLTEVYATGDFSYWCERFAGDRFVMIGDAAAFLDPVFSTGVYVAMLSAQRAVADIERAFAKNDFARRAFRRYERYQRRFLRHYFHLIYMYYRHEFFEFFLNPGNPLRVQQAVSSYLAGKILGAACVTWRMKLFFTFVRTQKFVPIVERIDYAKIPARPIRFPHESPSFKPPS